MMVTIRPIKGLILKRWLILSLLSPILVACQVLRPPDVQATLRAENVAYRDEATAVAVTSQAQQENTQATVEAAGTHVSELDNINQQLVATVRAAVPPTPRRIVGAASEAIMTPGMEEFTGAPSALQVAEVSTSAAVSSSDGCPTSVQNQFTADTPEIYVTARAFNITAGTQMGVEWYYQGQVVLQDTWTIQTTAPVLCVWYFITPADVPFSPGQWSVRLSANGVPVEQQAVFTIVG